MIRSLGQHFGDYRLVRMLGSGGFAEVYEAEHLHLPGVKVAVKLLKEIFTPQQIGGLQREALLVSTLGSGLRENDGPIFIVAMEKEV